MASGLPVVVTDGPGNREWVTSEGGFLAPAGDPVRFAEALVRVSRLDDPSWHAVSAHNREVATRRADWAKNVGRLLVAYECAASRG